MIGSVLGLTPAQIIALRAAPSLVHDLALVVHDRRWKALFEDVLQHAQAEQRAELEARQARFGQSPAGRQAIAREAEAHLAIASLGALESALSLEASWRLLHFMLGGNASVTGSLGDLLLNGEGLGHGGSARLHDEAQTRELSRYLAAQDVERLLRAHDMPQWQGSDHENDLREEVRRHFPRLRDYARAMADKGNGLIVLVD